MLLSKSCLFFVVHSLMQLGIRWFVSRDLPNIGRTQVGTWRSLYISVGGMFRGLNLSRISHNILSWALSLTLPSTRIGVSSSF